MMTLLGLAEHRDMARWVGSRPDRRWNRRSPTLRGSDGHSRETWFDDHEPDDRVRLLRAALLEQRPWQPLLRVLLPKPGKAVSRPVDFPTCLDQARIYVLADWLGGHAETVLSNQAVAFRRGRRFDRMLKTVANVIRKRGCVWAAALDIRDFFGSLRWSRLDGILASLPADDAIQGLLRALVRVEVLDKASKLPVARGGRGIPQGLSVSPVLANLYLCDTDREMNQALSQLEAWVYRYCDDLLIIARSERAAVAAVEIVRDRLVQLGFALKEGMGSVLDVRSEPVTWLGLALSDQSIDVPPSVMQNKIDGFQQKATHGLLTAEGIEDSLAGLEAHYRNILLPNRCDEVMATMRRGIADIHFPIPPQRKEVAVLQRLLRT